MSTENQENSLVSPIEQSSTDASNAEPTSPVAPQGTYASEKQELQGQAAAKSNKLLELFQLQSRIEVWRTKPWWRLESAILGGAIVAGLFAGVLGHINDNASKRQLRELFSTHDVVVAARDMAYGERIEAAMLKTVPMLERNISTNTVTPEGAGIIIGKRISLELKAGDPIMLSAVQGATEASRMAETIPPGKRLFTLTITDTAASHGFIKPNDHVDILAHVTLPERGLTSFTVLQDMTLVSVGPSTILSDSGKSTGASDVSFFVDAKETEILAFAQRRGQFSLSLRNPLDVSHRDDTRGVDINEFLDHDGIHQASGGGALAVTEKGHHIDPKADLKGTK